MRFIACIKNKNTDKNNDLHKKLLVSLIFTESQNSDAVNYVMFLKNFQIQTVYSNLPVLQSIEKNYFNKLFTYDWDTAIAVISNKNSSEITQPIKFQVKLPDKTVSTDVIAIITDDMYRIYQNLEKAINLKEKKGIGTADVIKKLKELDNNLSTVYYSGKSNTIYASGSDLNPIYFIKTKSVGQWFCLSKESFVKAFYQTGINLLSGQYEEIEKTLLLNNQTIYAFSKTKNDIVEVKKLDTSVNKIPKKQLDYLNIVEQKLKEIPGKHESIKKYLFSKYKL